MKLQIYPVEQSGLSLGEGRRGAGYDFGALPVHVVLELVAADVPRPGRQEREQRQQPMPPMRRLRERIG